MSLDNLALRGNEAQYAMCYLRLRAGWRHARPPKKNGRHLVDDPVRRVRIERLVDQLIEDACRSQGRVGQKSSWSTGHERRGST